MNLPFILILYSNIKSFAWNNIFREFTWENRSILSPAEYDDIIIWNQSIIRNLKTNDCGQRCKALLSFVSAAVNIDKNVIVFEETIFVSEF